MQAVERNRRKRSLAQNGSDIEGIKPTRNFDWRTTDQEEIELRQRRALEEQPRIRNLEPAWRIFSQFEVISRSGMTYSVELRSLAERVFSCTCTDFRINGLGTCKHVEAVLLHLEARFPKIFAEAQENGFSQSYSHTKSSILSHNGFQDPLLERFRFVSPSPLHVNRCLHRTLALCIVIIFRQ